MERASRRQTICLTMIVKNEAHVIERCLASVKPLVSSWLIVDTGSTDGTQDIIRAFMAGIPGEVHERPWVDFGHNRTEAIELARGKADYDLVIDADDVLRIPEGFVMPPLTADSYDFRIEDGGMAYFRVQLFRGNLDFRYVGALHEVVISLEKRSLGRLDGIVYQRIQDGARSADPEKFRKDAAVLEAALAIDPTNARNAFYLANSWRDAGEFKKAAACYERRATMGGFDEEVWTSLYQRARMAERLDENDAAVTAAYLRAFEHRPERAESLCELARCLRTRGRAAAAYPFARAASDIPRPSDLLFVDESVYAWRALDELGVSAYHAKRYAEGLAACERLLRENVLPASEKARVEANLAFCRGKLSAV